MEYDEWAVCLTSVVQSLSEDNEEISLINVSDCVKPLDSAIQTECLYLYNDGMSTTTLGTVVVAINHLTDSKHGLYKVMVQSTVFYPQGGGQPSDTGTMVTNGNIFEVRHVQQGSDGIVEHIGDIIQGCISAFTVGTNVNLYLNIELRIINTRLHSAGHAIDAAFYRLGYKDRIHATKGYHFTDGPYVEYSGDLTSDEIKTLPNQLTEMLDTIIAERLVTKVFFS